jgi:phosphoribosylformylglycinamidine cyclo-ligase
MGHRLEIYTNENSAYKIIDIASSFDIEAQIIGKVEKASQKKLTIKNSIDEFIYGL